MFSRLLLRLAQNAATVALSAFILTALVLMGTLFRGRGQTLMRDELRERLRGIAAVSALQFSPDDLNQLHVLEDIKKPVYRDMIKRLNDIRDQNKDIRFIYILRALPNGTYEFVADADSLSPVAIKDLNGDGKLDEEDEPAPTGTPYENDDPVMPRGLLEPVTDDAPYSDQWGTYISGFAPIRDAAGHTTDMFLGVDMDAAHFVQLSNRIFSPVLLLLVILLGLGIAGYVTLSFSRRRLQELRDLEAARSGLLRLTYHQLGQPLTILKWTVESLGDGKVSEEELKSSIANLADVTGRIDGVFQALAKADRVHRGELQYKAEPVSLETVVQNVVDESRARIAQRKYRVVTSVDPGLTVTIDQTLIAGVLGELLKNAMDYSHEGKEIAVTVRRTKAGIRASVIDHGVGIPASELPKIATEYYRATNSGHMKPDGNGLGLFIARGIVRRAGGDLTVESVEGEGTTVSFTLPV